MVFANKRGQFFLLAAVIISAVTLSFGSITNNAIVTSEPDDLSDYSYNIKREAGSVIDYEIYHNFAPNANLSDFITLLASEIREKDSEINFLFVYGNNDSVTIRNYGSEGVKTCNRGSCNYSAGAKSKIKSRIRWGSSSKDITGTYDKFRDNWKYTQTSLGPKANITMNVRGNDFTFDIGKSRQVIFVMQKEDKDESYVYIR